MRLSGCIRFMAILPNVYWSAYMETAHMKTRWQRWKIWQGIVILISSPLFPPLQNIPSYINMPREVRIPGKRPYKKAGGAGLIPKATQNCTECGLCAKQCPYNARKINGAMVSIASLAIKKACPVRKECELFILQFYKRIGHLSKGRCFLYPQKVKL